MLLWTLEMRKPLILIFLMVVIATAEVNETKTTPAITTETTLKGSQEDIMFGNQQNKPAGMVDDLLSFKQPENRKKNRTEATKVEQAAAKFDKTKGFDYYDYLQEPEENTGSDVSYPLDESPREPQIYNTHEMVDDYDGVLYRRKRKVNPMVIRNIRSNIEELMGRNRRLPRRAIRIKRDAGVEQLVTWLGMLRRGQQGEVDGGDIYEPEVSDEAVQSPDLSYFYDVPKVEVPELPPALLETLVAADAPALSRDPPSDVIPLLRYPSPFNRRSNFYPVDYRYVLVPGQKRGESRVHLGEQQVMRDEDSMSGGQWGGFGGRRDNQRLYALANLLADDTNLRRKRTLKA